MSELKQVVIPGDFVLESGEVLHDVKIAYHTYGTYDSNKNNVVWVCHALTANSDVFDWWAGVFGEDDLFNPTDYFIVCANVIGSHYGSTGPLNTQLASGVLALQDFPLVTPRDMARAHELLRKHLTIEEIYLLVGASLGGQQAQEFTLLSTCPIHNLILIATNAKHSPFGIAFNAAQRLAIEADQTYGDGPTGGTAGLIAARSIAMLSYRSYTGYLQTQAESSDEVLKDFRASSYQQYQGTKLANRFNAYSYVTLSKAMDAHHVGRGRGGILKALSSIRSKTLIIGITTDLLFPVEEQKYLQAYIPDAVYAEIDSAFGHDGFLVEHNQLIDIISDFLFNNFSRHKVTTFKQQHEL